MWTARKLTEVVNITARHAGLWRNGGITPLFLHLGIRWWWSMWHLFKGKLAGPQSRPGQFRGQNSGDLCSSWITHSVGSQLPTFRDNISGVICKAEVVKRIIPEDRRFHLYPGGRLNSGQRKFFPLPGVAPLLLECPARSRVSMPTDLFQWLWPVLR
jgi:hypothetical protein